MINTIVCKNCEHKFNPTRKWQKFCSPKCRLQYWRSHKAEIGQLQKKITNLETRLKRLESPGQ